MPDVYLVSLGCDKNRVDGEVMVGTLRGAGFSVVNNPEEAEAIIVNTCGFISDAVAESLDTVFELAEYKQDKCRALIVVGCMAERYKDEIKAQIPEADAFVGVGEYEKIAEILAGLIGAPAGAMLPTTADWRLRLGARSDSEIPHVAYVKIAEGCDNSCSYCTIPKIRGKYKSRPEEEILEECCALVNAGAVELVLVAQDTASYGTDIYGAKKLPELLREIAQKSGAKWVRLMYAYPEQITAALIDVISETPEICKYIDMPIQHSEDAVLTGMGRRGTKYELERLICVLRDRVPGIAIRTTLMVGFPGETEENFNAMLDFVEEMRFDRMGAFPYSREEGTSAADFPEQISDEIKSERHSRLMEIQQEIHFARQEKFVGRTLDVIVDSQNDDGTFIGRTQHDAYEVDGVVYITSSQKLARGQIVPVKIIAADGYDLTGETA
ncbi:MAG: 30S ribosomal protein S12 methylthiotransferase RimO [Defluviitaleaceae bacterium]|nr:30S ribosomal protein S12 methylthiotransferase RimO [Defluviitaleaceae bacterium]